VKTIPLTKGMEAVVDDCDYEYLTQWKWYFVQPDGHKTGYAQRMQRVRGKRLIVHMHSLVGERSGLEIDGEQIDHIDRNGLNNRRINLRAATTGQNKANQGRYHNNTSGYKGVYWELDRGKWRAQVGIRGRRVHLGRFNDPRDAARAYNEAAMKHFGEFACLNPV